MPQGVTKGGNITHDGQVKDYIDKNSYNRDHKIRKRKKNENVKKKEKEQPRDNILTINKEVDIEIRKAQNKENK